MSKVDLSFLTDKPKEDLSFLTDKPVDLSFLTDKPESGIGKFIKETGEGISTIAQGIYGQAKYNISQAGGQRQPTGAEMRGGVAPVPSVTGQPGALGRDLLKVAQWGSDLTASTFGAYANFLTHPFLPKKVKEEFNKKLNAQLNNLEKSADKLSDLEVLPEVAGVVGVAIAMPEIVAGAKNIPETIRILKSNLMSKKSVIQKYYDTIKTDQEKYEIGRKLVDYLRPDQKKQVIESYRVVTAPEQAQRGIQRLLPPKGGFQSVAPPISTPIAVKETRVPAKTATGQPIVDLNPTANTPKDVIPETTLEPGHTFTIKGEGFRVVRKGESGTVIKDGITSKLLKDASLAIDKGSLTRTGKAGMPPTAVPVGIKPPVLAPETVKAGITMPEPVKPEIIGKSTTGKPVASNAPLPVTPKPKEINKQGVANIFPLGKDKILKEIGDAIKKAPEVQKYKTVSEMQLQEDGGYKSAQIQVPDTSDTVSFKIDGGFKVFNNKHALQEFYKNVKSTSEKVKIGEGLKVRQTFAGEPRAQGVELIGKKSPEGKLELVSTKGGYFTDGILMIKGEPPKNIPTWKGRSVTKGQMEEILEIKTKPAKLQHYMVDRPGAGMIGKSDKPIYPTKEGGMDIAPKVIFKVGNNYAMYDQKRFVAITNRYPDPNWGISDEGMLVAYENEKPVAALMGMETPEALKGHPALSSKEPILKIGEKVLSETGGISPEAMNSFKKSVDKYFLRSMGAAKEIDVLNDERVGQIARTLWDAPHKGKALLQWIDKVGEQGEEVARQALRGQLPMEQVPEEIRPIIQSMRNDIDKLSRIVVEKGVIPENLRIAIDKNIGKYIVRAYRLHNQKNYVPSPEIVEKAKLKLKEMHPRIFKNLSPEDMDGVIKNILDRRDFLLNVAGKKAVSIPQNHFIRRKNIPKEIRDLYGEIENINWLYLKTVSDLTTVAHNTEFLGKVSQIPGIYSKVPTNMQFKQLPEGRRWGLMSGKYVDDTLYEFLTENIGKQESTAMRMIEKYVVNPFKWAKTVGNIPSHPRNLLGNISFAILDGVSPANPLNFKYYTKAGEIIATKNTTNQKIWGDLIENGVTENQYWGGEMPKLMSKLLKIAPPSLPEKIQEIAINKPMNFLGELYNAEDQIYRIASYFKKIDKGMSPKDAAREVDRKFTNYTKVPLITKIGRRYAVLGPFLSFKSETIRIYSNAMKDAVIDAKQGKFGKLAALAFVLGLPTLMSEVSKEVNDIDDEEINKLNKIMPPYRRGGAMVYYRDGSGALKAFDLTYIMPSGDFGKAINSVLHGDMQALSDSLNFMEHPLIGALEIVKDGTDPYMHFSIRNKDDSMSKQAANTVSALIKSIYLPLSSPIPQLSALLKGEIKPGFLTGQQIKTLMDTYNEITDKYGRVRELPEELKNFFTGIRTWRVYPEILVKNYIDERKFAMRENKAELGRWLRNNMKANPSEIKQKTDEYIVRSQKIAKDIEMAASIKLNKLEPK